MNVYVAVAEEQGFAAAGRRLKLSPPAVTRAVAELEEKLGVKLLHRTTRYVRMTDAGARYLEDVRRILHDIEMANEAAIGINAEPRGLLTITAPVLFGQKYVIPGIVAYLKAYPRAEVKVVLLDRLVNLLEEGFDLAIRIGDLPDSSMRAKWVGNVRLILVASPEYLNEQGVPRKPDDLGRHTLISSSSNSLAQDWQYVDGEKKRALRIRPRLTVTTNQAAINAAKEGFGITRVISYQVADEIASGELKTVLDAYALPSMPIHVVHHEGLVSSGKVRRFIDLLAERLKNDPALR
ncbi:MAG: LysR family transcriptional regulator [Gammaproteobacteria bacterium]|nr:LysR family transcriptional regulator [Gammaproteobacteria bacterium]